MDRKRAFAWENERTYVTKLFISKIETIFNYKVQQQSSKIQ